jgi:DNA-binding response OmpR family regulator
MSTSPTAKKILLIEDDRLLAGALARKFLRAGLNPTVCYDGSQGLERLQHETFAAVVLDLMMPVKDGFAVLAQKKNTPNAQTSAYVLTTNGQEEKGDLALALGARQVFLESQIGVKAPCGSLVRGRSD